MGRSKRSKKSRQIEKIVALIVFIVCAIISVFYGDEIFENDEQTVGTSQSATYLTIDDIPEYSGKPWVSINNNVPYFEESEYKTEPFENYSKQDELGRCRSRLCECLQGNNANRKKKVY